MLRLIDCTILKAHRDICVYGVLEYLGSGRAHAMKGRFLMAKGRQRADAPVPRAVGVSNALQQ